MRSARVFMHGILAGILEETEPYHRYRFTYCKEYKGEPVSLTMPLEKKVYEFNRFPPFFEGLLPEGMMLEGLLQHRRIDRADYFSQLMAVGKDLVGAVTVEEIE